MKWKMAIIFLIEGVLMALKDCEIGGKVRKIRKEKGMTQEQFAKRFHMTQQTLSKYENGKITISYDTLENIAEGTKISIGYFLGIDSMVLSDDEVRLIEFYRSSDARVRKYIYETVCILSTQFQGKDQEQ